MTLKANIPDSNATSSESRSMGVVDKPIVLVGLMGAGKSSIGKRLAKAIKVPFRDSEYEITQAAACSITDIFEIYGESMFRDLERRVMTRLLTEEKPAVIATGGGAFIQPKIREAVKQNAVSIWLDADVDVLYERVSRKRSRPLLEKGDKRQILQDLLTERTPYYAEATITISSDMGAHENVVSKALEALTPYFPAEDT
ncbi:MAG: shikimate kinase [Alphaproteobacteria bacterium]|nr:shikimate kinase [Alphaproteobacteria bacterium]